MTEVEYIRTYMSEVENIRTSTCMWIDLNMPLYILQIWHIIEYEIAEDMTKIKQGIALDVILANNILFNLTGSTSSH